MLSAEIDCKDDGTIRCGGSAKKGFDELLHASEPFLPPATFSSISG